jgi:3-methyladenine DNA glycosylase AlkC
MTTTKGQPFLLRDVFNPAAVEQLADGIARVWPAFDRAGFVATITSQLDALSFGGRNALIRDTLRAYLPSSFPEAVQILLDALGPEISDCELTGFDRFTVMSQNDFVAAYGLEHLDLSLRALYELTKRFTAEGAIRAFLQQYPEQTLVRLAEWAADPNCHVRRLVSEGTRPRLPLAPRLRAFVKDPRPVLELLELLKADPVLMVRRSVANNLNDIAKDHPDLVVETLARWKQAGDPGTEWIIGHATRTLLKQGHSGALALLGYEAKTAISAASLQLNQTSVRMGEDLVFTIEIQSTADAPQDLMIDYLVHHRKANGKLAPKVFKLSKKRLGPRETLRLTKRHAFRPLSTRVYYPGRHALEIQINGQRWGWQEFELVFGADTIVKR